MGDKPVVVFLRLLWTVVAIGSQVDQSSGWLEVTRRRYCSTHWFFRSDSPSVWGWKAVDRFCRIPNHMVSAFPKCDVKRGSRSVISLVGSLNHRYTCSRYNWAIPTPVIVVEQGRNMALLEHPWSTIVSIASWPRTGGRPVIRSMQTCWKGSALGSVVIW